MQITDLDLGSQGEEVIQQVASLLLESFKDHWPDASHFCILGERVPAREILSASAVSGFREGIQLFLPTLAHAALS